MRKMRIPDEESILKTSKEAENSCTIIVSKYLRSFENPHRIMVSKSKIAGNPCIIMVSKLIMNTSEK